MPRRVSCNRPLPILIVFALVVPSAFAEACAAPPNILLIVSDDQGYHDLGLLDEHDIADNTIVIFFSDNGGGGGADNSPLKGRKGWMFEGGIRVPCIVRYPSKIPAGQKCDEFLTSLEIVPTLLNLVGVQPPDDLKLDGFDMLPVLTSGASSPRSELFWQRKADKAARVGNWKWVDSERGGGLFDLSKDIGEQNDLSKTNPQKLQEMQAHFARWRSEMDAAEPRGPFRDF